MTGFSRLVASEERKNRGNISGPSCMHPGSAAEGFSQSETASLCLKPLMDLLPLDLSCGLVNPCQLPPTSFPGQLCALWKVAPVAVSNLLLCGFI